MLAKWVASRMSTVILILASAHNVLACDVVSPAK